MTLEEQIEKMIKRAMYGFPWEQYKYGPRLYHDLAELMRERERAAREGLYKMIHLGPEVDGVPMQYLGAYILKWDGDARPKAEVGFVKAEEEGDG